MTIRTDTPASPAAVALDDRLLDRLVDGELDEPERRRVLLALDHDPAGWKRCALAFLEAQAFQQAVRARAAAPTTITPPAGREGRRVPRRLLGLAAAVAIAFCVGFASRPAGTTNVAVRGGPEVPERRAVRHVAPEAWLAASDPSGNPLPIPLYAAGGPGAAPAATQPAIPSYLRHQLAREGYEVRNDRKMVSVALKDGRTATVPVETVQYRYVGQRVY